MPFKFLHAMMLSVGTRSSPNTPSRENFRDFLGWIGAEGTEFPDTVQKCTIQSCTMEAVLYFERSRQ